MTSSRDASTITYAVLAVLCWFKKWGRQRTGSAVLVYYDIFTAGRKGSLRIQVCKELFRYCSGDQLTDLCAVRWCVLLPSSSATSSVVRDDEGKVLRL